MKNLKTITAAAMALTIALGGGVWASQAHAADAASHTIQSELQAKKPFGRDHGPMPGQNQSGDAQAIKGHLPFGGKGGIQMDKLADLVGVTIDNFKEALSSGKTIAAVAAENGVDVQTVIDQIVQAQTVQLDQLLADGKLTQEQYDSRKAGLADMASKLVNGEMGGKGDFRGGKGGFLPDGDRGKGGIHGIQSEELASTLGVTKDELSEALRSGKTIADIAAEKGIAVQTVIDQIVQAQTAQLDKQLADGKLTQEQYDSRKAGLADSAAKLVNGEAGGKGDFRGDKGGFPGKDGFTKSKRPFDAANADSGSSSADNDSGSAEASASE